MENAPKQIGYITEIQRVARLEIIEVRTTKTYSPWQKKSESVIRIVKGKENIRIVKRNIPKRVWDSEWYGKREYISASRTIPKSHTLLGIFL